jgi:hypothetical protein
LNPLQHLAIALLRGYRWAAFADEKRAFRRVGDLPFHPDMLGLRAGGRAAAWRLAGWRTLVPPALSLLPSFR